MLRIVSADPQSVAVALGVEIDMPAVALVGIDDDVFAGSGGLAWGKGRCWIWFSVVNGKPEYARPVLRTVQMLKAKARQLGETEIFTIRDPGFKSSAKLNRLCGFEFFGIEDGQEVFRCIL